MANDVNVVAISGRLTRDAELKYSNSGFAICTFSIASNWSKKQGDGWTEEVSFFDCVMFGKRAEALHQYMTKGKQLMLQCQARQDRWQNNEGQSRSKVNFVVDSLVFGSGGGSGGGNGGANRQEQRRDPAADFDEAAGDGDFEDDVPF